MTETEHIWLYYPVMETVRVLVMGYILYHIFDILRYANARKEQFDSIAAKIVFLVIITIFVALWIWLFKYLMNIQY